MAYSIPSRLFLLTLLLAGSVTHTSAEVAEHVFDGAWETTLSCPNAAGALGFSFRFPAIVKDSVLHGEKGTRGEPGWLQLDGTILANGKASIYADGLVGASAYAVGQRPVGSAYGYHLDVQFTATQGSGTRVEGRPCTITFTKTP